MHAEKAALDIGTDTTPGEETQPKQSLVLLSCECQEPSSHIRPKALPCDETSTRELTGS